MKYILFDLMDTVVSDPYYNTVSQLTPPHVDFHEFQSVRNKNSFLSFEKGEISELDFFSSYYLESFDFEKEGFPRPQKIKKYLYRKINYLDGMENILKKIKTAEDVRLGIASNYSVWYLEIFKKLSNLEDYFDYMFFSCEMGIRKPSEKYFHLIQNALGGTGEFDPGRDEILFIDDRAENVRAAEQAGWKSVHFTGVPALIPVLEKNLGVNI